MLLPENLSKKINEIYSGLKNEKIKDIQKRITTKYKNKSGSSKNLIETENESILYAVSRMPATYSVVRTLINQLISQKAVCTNLVNKIVDFGAGTGSVYFATRDIFNNSSYELIEKNKNMANIFSKLSDEKVEYSMCDIISDKINVYADLTTACYFLSELNEVDRKNVFEKILDCSKHYCLIIDTGTPGVFCDFMKLISVANKKGFQVVSPCKCNPCPLENDYCQFYARVERSSLLSIAKSASLPYEDEKYFYLLFEKDGKIIDENSSRVIRRPTIRKGEVELLLCTKCGVMRKKFSKSNEKYKLAKKIKINDEI